MSGRDANQLADVRLRVTEALDYAESRGITGTTAIKVEDIRALVARITDLEAQVAALTQERDQCEREIDAMDARRADEWQRAEAAEAALATARQALAFIAAKIEEGDYGAALSRAISASPTPEWDSTEFERNAAAARRALADTGGDTEEGKA